MAGSIHCRLCRSNCRSTFRLHDANGHPTKIFDISVTFFHPTLLQEENDCGNSMAVLCQKCWHHISEFHSFQQTILILHEDLVEDAVQIISKLSCSNPSFNQDEEYLYSADTPGLEAVTLTNCDIRFNANERLCGDVITVCDSSNEDASPSQEQMGDSSAQLIDTESTIEVATNLRRSDDLRPEGASIKIREDLFDIRDYDLTIAQKGTSAKLEDELFDISSDDEHSQIERNNNLLSSDNSNRFVEIESVLRNIEDTSKFVEIESNRSSLEKTSKTRTKNKRGIISSKNRCRLGDFDNNNKVVEIESIRSSLEKTSKTRCKYKRSRFASQNRCKSLNSDNSNKFEEIEKIRRSLEKTSKCSSDDSDNSNAVVGIGSTNTSLENKPTARSKRKRHRIPSEDRYSSDNSDNSIQIVEIGSTQNSLENSTTPLENNQNRDDSEDRCSSVNSHNSEEIEENIQNSLENTTSTAGPKNKRDSTASAMVDATIARWKPWLECNICPANFALYSDIKLHYRNDHPQTKFSIFCCGRILRERFRIEEHARLHSNPKAFECKDCGKCFSGKYILENHRKSHLPGGGPQYKHICDICGKNYRIPSALLEHYAIHMGKKINNCTYCSKSFKYRPHLSRHISEKHPEKLKKVKSTTKYKCSSCPKAFMYGTGLIRHIKREHPENLSHIKEI